MNAQGLADDLAAYCLGVTEDFFGAYAPNARLPRTLAGHGAGADVRADVIFTLGHLAAAGVDAVVGVPIESLIETLLGEVDGLATHSFFSYRIAESLLEHGPFYANPLLAALSDTQRAQVAEACDSSSFLKLLDEGHLPRNYAAVLSRCEQARVRLGLSHDPTSLPQLLERLRKLLGENPRHCLDDSNDGSGRYDIYSVDVWLFCEPLAGQIGPEWRSGMADALALAERVVGSDGTAIPWGRSTGGLSVALTVELAAIALKHGIGDDPSAWLRRGCDAAKAMRSWFGPNGLVNAHQHRDQDSYRGPARRLQLTFDLLGKLAWTARTLRETQADIEPSSHAMAYPPIDQLSAFDDRTTARLWAYRDERIAFALPLVGTARSHYLPAPVRPGPFEVPVDADLPCWTPLVIDGYQRYVGAGLPSEVQHSPGSLTAKWDGFVPASETFSSQRVDRLPGERQARWQVDGRSIIGQDSVRFEHVPQAVSVCIPEIAASPLNVKFECQTPHATSTVEVDGIAEWRSSWSSIRRVHQLDLDPASELCWTVRVTPKLRIASTAHGHHYDRSLYGRITDQVFARPMPLGLPGQPQVGLNEIDLFHLHWPEWLAFDDLGEHRRIADALGEHRIPVMWTAHNLTPHSKEPDKFDPVYALWAERARAVIHHSEWGKAKLLARYHFPAQVRHVVIPHGHFEQLWASSMTSRAAAETALGFEPCALRIGIVGAPRKEKAVLEFCQGFVASSRTDIQLAVWSGAFGESLPVDPRIVAAESYRSVDTETYALRLSACDLLALPFDPDGDMLATGTLADAIGLGIPVLASDWGFLVEYLGETRISIGHASAPEVTAAIDALSSEQVSALRAGMPALKSRFDWAQIAEATLDLAASLATAS